MTSSTHRALIPVPQALQSERITLRPYILDDAAAFWEAVQEDVAQEGNPWRGSREGPQTVEDVRDRIVHAQARWLLREELMMGIFMAMDGHFIGNAVLTNIDWELRRFEMGYWVRRSEEGCGYASEAVRLLTRCAFESLGARRVEIRCDERNTRSRHVAERQGFAREGLLRNSFLRKTGPSNTLVFALIPEDYACIKETWPAVL